MMMRYETHIVSSLLFPPRSRPTLNVYGCTRLLVGSFPFHLPCSATRPQWCRLVDEMHLSTRIDQPGAIQKLDSDDIRTLELWHKQWAELGKLSSTHHPIGPIIMGYGRYKNNEDKEKMVMKAHNQRNDIVAPLSILYWMICRRVSVVAQHQ